MTAKSLEQQIDELNEGDMKSLKVALVRLIDTNPQAVTDLMNTFGALATGVAFPAETTDRIPDYQELFDRAVEHLFEGIRQWKAEHEGIENNRAQLLMQARLHPGKTLNHNLFRSPSGDIWEDAKRGRVRGDKNDDWAWEPTREGNDDFTKLQRLEEENGARWQKDHEATVRFADNIQDNRAGVVAWIHEWENRTDRPSRRDQVSFRAFEDFVERFSSPDNDGHIFDPTQLECYLNNILDLTGKYSGDQSIQALATINRLRRQIVE